MIDLLLVVGPGLIGLVLPIQLVLEHNAASDKATLVLALVLARVWGKASEEKRQLLLILLPSALVLALVLVYGYY